MTPPLAQLERAYIKCPVQEPNELKSFCKFVTNHNVESYLEIGAKYGGSLWHVVKAMPKGSRALAVDLPFMSTFKRPVSEPYLKQVAQELNQNGYDVKLIFGDSTDPAIVQQVKEHAPFDLCLIDANHMEAYVRSDWANYGPLAKIVAFHDVGWDMTQNAGKLFVIDVPKVWNEIKQAYRHIEIKLDPSGQHNGFGILWR